MHKYKWAVISREWGSEKWEIAEHTISMQDSIVHPLAVACTRNEARLMKLELEFWEGTFIEFKVVKLANSIDAKSFVMQYGCYTA
jgi:hypothetical protein